MTPVLPAFYFGSVEHYALLARHPQIIIDIGEHYARQSYRTRTGIVGPNGPQHLSVQVEHDHGKKMPMCEVELSYTETWPQQHLHAIRSAYGQTPWFIHYIDDIEGVLLGRHARLTDLLQATMRLGLRWLGLGTDLVVVERYVDMMSDEWRVTSDESADSATRHPPLAARRFADLRTTFHPKKPLPPEVPAVPLYPQVFADRHGFVPRMSVIDLVCNCGPEAERIIAG